MSFGSGLKRYACESCGSGIWIRRDELGRAAPCDACRHVNVFWSDTSPMDAPNDKAGEIPESEEELVRRVSELEGQLDRARRQLDLCRQATQLENELLQTRAQLKASDAEPVPVRRFKSEATPVSGQGRSNKPMAIIVFSMGAALGGSTRSGLWDDYSIGVYYFVLFAALLTCSWGVSLWKGLS